MTLEEIEKALIRLDRLVADALDREDEWVDGADTGDVQTALNLARQALALEKSGLVEQVRNYVTPNRPGDFGLLQKALTAYEKALK